MQAERKLIYNMYTSEQLLFEINGRKYVLIEELFTSASHKKMQAKYKKYECIEQGIKEINRGGFFQTAFAIIKVLVPEENISAFNNE